MITPDVFELLFINVVFIIIIIIIIADLRLSITC